MPKEYYYKTSIMKINFDLDSVVCIHSLNCDYVLRHWFYLVLTPEIKLKCDKTPKRLLLLQ